MDGRSAKTAIFDAGPAEQANEDVASLRRPPFLRRLRHALASRLLVSAALVLVLEQPCSGAYAIRGVVTAGGSPSHGGSFRLDGAFGQVPTDVSAAAGFRLYPGLWAPDSDSIFANGFN